MSTDEAIKSPDHAAQGKNFLEALPQEVCNIIAENLLRACHNSHDWIICFAQTGEKQERAVLAALSGKIRLSQRLDETSNWGAFALPHTRDLDISRLQWADSWQERRLAVLAFLTSHSLDRLTMEITKSCLRSMMRSRCSIRSLTLKARDSCHAGWPLVLAALASQNLEQLVLQCHSYSDCLLAKLDVSSRDPSLLGKACPRVSDVCLDCTCHGAPEHWKILAEFKSLRKTTFYQQIPEEEIDRFRSLDETRVLCESGSFYLAKRLGRNVTIFKDIDEYCDDEQIQSLAVCTRLKEFSAAPRKDALHALSALSSSLEALHLSRPTYGRSDDESDDDEHIGESPFTLTTGLLPIVQNLPLLESLTLSCVSLPLSELESILKTTGPRLKKFGTSLENHEHSRFERLASVVGCLVTFNKSLELFSIIDGFEAAVNFADLALVVKSLGLCKAGISILRRRGTILKCPPTGWLIIDSE